MRKNNAPKMPTVVKSYAEALARHQANPNDIGASLTLSKWHQKEISKQKRLNRNRKLNPF